MLQLSGVSKWYLNHNKVLDHVSLELKKGDFVYVVGGTGAGKSTLLRILATEEVPSMGTVSLFGYDLAKVSPSTLQAIRRSLGYIPQNIRLIPELSIFDNIALSLSLAGRRSLNAESRKLIHELIERLGLGKNRNQPCSGISGGEAQRVAVARALARKPELVIADEPTGAQDAEHTWSMMELFVRANVLGASLVVATHDQDIVRRLRKRCVLLRGGRLILEGAVSSCATY